MVVWDINTYTAQLVTTEGERIVIRTTPQSDISDIESDNEDEGDSSSSPYVSYDNDTEAAADTAGADVVDDSYTTVDLHSYHSLLLI